MSSFPNAAMLSDFELGWTVLRPQTTLPVLHSLFGGHGQLLPLRRRRLAARGNRRRLGGHRRQQLAGVDRRRQGPSRRHSPDRSISVAGGPAAGPAGHSLSPARRQSRRRSARSARRTPGIRLENVSQSLVRRFQRRPLFRPIALFHPGTDLALFREQFASLTFGAAKPDAILGRVQPSAAANRGRFPRVAPPYDRRANCRTL